MRDKMIDLMQAGYPLLENLSLDWEFHQSLGKNLGI